MIQQGAFSPLEFPDSVEYHTMARAAAEGRGFEGNATRAPLYPAFMAACLVVGRGYIGAVIIAQIVVDGLMCVALFALARRLVGERGALLAAGMACVYPFFIYYTTRALTETLFTFLLVLGMMALCRLKTDPRAERAGLAGVLFGLGCLAKGSLLGMLFFILPFWWLWLDRARKLRTVILFVVMACVVLLPWAGRNYKVTKGHVVLTAARAGRSLYEGFAPEADGGPAMHKIDWPDLPGLDPCEEDRELGRRALQIMLGDPGRSLRLAWAKFRRFWAPVPNYEAYRGGFYCAVSLLSYVPVALLAVFGVLRYPARWRESLFLLCPAIYFSLLHSVFIGSIRYRAPVMPFLMILAARGLAPLLFRTSPEPDLHTVLP
jgi:4-amino-4-deoxy-L-arabinose transferase-like glycosyltransferase